MKRRPEFRMTTHRTVLPGDSVVAETLNYCIVMDESGHHWDDPVKGPVQDEEFSRLLTAAPALADVVDAFVAHYPMGTNPFLDEAFRLALQTTNQLKVKP